MLVLGRRACAQSIVLRTAAERVARSPAVRRRRNPAASALRTEARPVARSFARPRTTPRSLGRVSCPRTGALVSWTNFLLKAKTACEQLRWMIKQRCRPQAAAVIDPSPSGGGRVRRAPEGPPHVARMHNGRLRRRRVRWGSLPVNGVPARTARRPRSWCTSAACFSSEGADTYLHHPAQLRTSTMHTNSPSHQVTY